MAAYEIYKKNQYGQYLKDVIDGKYIDNCRDMQIIKEKEIHEDHRNRRRRIHRRQLHPPYGKQIPGVPDRNLDLLTYAGNLETLKPVENKPNYKFVKGDIADRKFVFDLFEKEKPDIVVNFAAESHVDRSVVDPESFVRTNVMGTTTLLDACRTYGIKRYHQVSTDEVYGDLPLDRPDLFFTEETPLHTPARILPPGKCRPLCSRLPQNIRTSGDDLPLLQQLWSVPLPGEADPVNDQPRSC